ncbi:hypothetical protein D3C86_895060 [compost metagenome]
MPSYMRRTTGCSGASSSLRKRELSMGMRPSATIIEQVRAKTTTKESCLNMTPVMPVRKMSGTKTASVVKVEAATASETCLVPSRAAWSGFLPISRWRKMFSMTTIESSNRRPMPSARPPSDMVLRVKFWKYKRAKVAMTETGMAVATIRVLRRLRRKKSSTSTASAEPITRSLAMWWMAREMKREESLVT